MKKQLMTLANKLRSTLGSMSAALKKAWEIMKLRAEMKASAVWFTFTKRDGSLRRALGTLSSGIIDSHIKGGAPARPATQIVYFDLEALAFRSFVASNFEGLEV